MTHIVQEFIEQSITYIDHEDYFSTFMLWYKEYSDSKHDKALLEELFFIFDQAGIALREESLSDRALIIKEQMFSYIDNVLQKTVVDEVTLPIVNRHLKSSLGFSLVKLNELFKEVGNNIATVHNVRLEPFKIVRK